MVLYQSAEGPSEPRYSELRGVDAIVHTSSVGASRVEGLVVSSEIESFMYRSTVMYKCSVSRNTL